MFGIHFKHVLVLTLLAGIAYSLPQVRDGLSDSFSSIYVQNQAAIFNYPNNNNVVNKIVDNRPPAIGVGEMKKMMIVPEEIVLVLVKEGIIPQDKAGIAVKVLKDKLFNNNQPIMPIGASTTVPNIIRARSSTSTRPMMKQEFQKPQYRYEEMRNDIQ